MSDELYLHAILRYKDIDTGEYIEDRDVFDARCLSGSELGEVLGSSSPVETYLRILKPDMNVWCDDDDSECWLNSAELVEEFLGGYVKRAVYYCWNPYLEHKKYLFEWLKKHEKRKIVWGMI